MSDRSLGTAFRAMPWVAALLLALAGCSDPPLIDGDGAIGPRDAGTGSGDSGGSTFRDGGGISINGLSLARVVPNHGPFTGGNQVVLRGSGFTAEAQVTFGGSEVQGADHRLIDPRRLAVIVPAGDPGTVDVSITVGDTTVTLEDGYTYDSIEITPSSGSVSGNTFVSLIGSGTRFAEGDTVTIGRTACRNVEVVSETRINCRTPAGAPGSVDVTVNTDGADVVIEDGFTYFDSADPTSGGLGGGPIEGQINLTVIDAMTGAPVADAYAIVGEDTTTEHQGLTDGGGQISFSGPDIAPPATVHIAKFCYERTSVVAFDARDVTVFLVPWMDPMCGMGEPPPPGRGRNGAFIEGELVWLRDFGLGPQEWFNVPEPRAGWVRAAYVYTTLAQLGYPNPDPAAGGSTQRVLESPVGERGYPYSIFARPAGLAVYALAGLENTSTGRFIPYVMGVARNVLAGPGQVVTGVDIVMDIPLDHYVDVQLGELPAEARTGPDRFRLQANIDLAGEGVIAREINGLEIDVLRGRDSSRPFRFTMQPALEGALRDGRYRIEAGWFTGDFDGQPYTVAVERGVTAVDDTIVMSDFLGIPQASAPEYGAMIPSDRVFRWESDGPDPAFQIVLIIGADGNSWWRMIVAGDVREAPVPDLSGIPTLGDLPPGYITWGVFAITIPDYDFDAFRYADLNDIYWTRWSADFFLAQR